METVVSLKRQKSEDSSSEEKLFFRVKKLSAEATLPFRGSTHAAGYDLSSAEEGVILPHQRKLFKTDLSFEIPLDCYAQIAPRSSLGLKGIDVGAGVVDADYRGNVGVILINHTDQDFHVKKGDRIAQVILKKIYLLPIQEVSELTETNRGSGGFGSTNSTSSKIEKASLDEKNEFVSIDF